MFIQALYFEVAMRRGHDPGLRLTATRLEHKGKGKVVAIARNRMEI